MAILGFATSTQFVSRPAIRPPALSMGISELVGAWKPSLITLAFGGGLLPGLAIANKAAFSTLGDSQRTAQLSEPTRGAAAGSQPLQCSALLAYPAPVLLDDIIAVLGRVDAAGNTLSCLQNDTRLVRRAEFESSISEMPAPTQQLLDSDGAALGLKPQLYYDGTPRGEPPAAIAVDAVWAALSGGAPYVAPQEISRCVVRVLMRLRLARLWLMASSVESRLRFLPRK